MKRDTMQRLGPRGIAVLGTALAGLALAMQAAAADFYWKGEGASDNLDDNGNWWVGGAHPSPGDNIHFDHSTGTKQPYNNYGVGGYFGSIISYDGGGAITWSGDDTFAFKFENSNNASLLKFQASIRNRSGYDVEVNPVGSGGIQVTGNVSVDADKWLKVYGSAQLEITGVISGSSVTMRMYDSPTVILGGENTFSGALDVFGGITDLRNTTDPLDVSGIYLGDTTGSRNATLQIGANNVTVDNPVTINAGSSGTLYIKNNYAGTGTFSSTVTLNQAFTASAVSGSTLVFGGVVSGDYDLTLNDAGTVRLTAENTFGSGAGTQKISINQGTLELSRAGGDPLDVDEVWIGPSSGTEPGTLKLSASAGFTVDQLLRSVATGTGTRTVLNAAGTNTLSGSVYLDRDLKLDVTGGSLSINGASKEFDLKDNTLTVQGANNTTIGPDIVIKNSSGTGTLTKSGTGTLTLSGDNTYSGGTTMNVGGVLNVVSATALGTGALMMGGSGTIDNTSGGALTIDNALRLTGGNITFKGTSNLTIGGDVLFSGGNRMVTVTANTLTLDGAISESGSRALTKAGNGTLVLGNANNAYTGMTTINSGGTLEVKYLADGGLNSSIGASGNAAANLRIMGTLKFSGAGAQTSDRLFSLGSANRLDASGATAGDTIAFSNTGSLAWTSVNYTLTLQGSNPGANTLACALVANGTNPLLKRGSGTWVLSGANTYTGLTTVGAAASGNDGVLRIASAAALGTAAAGVTIRGGSNTCRLELAGGITVTDEAVSLEGRATASAASLSNLAGNNTWTGTLTGGAQGAHYNLESQADLLTLSGTLTSNAGSATRTYNLKGAGNGLVSGVINDGTGGETVALTKSGAGTWTLASANTYAGATTISVGTLALSGAGAIDASPTIAVAGGATFDVSAVSYTLASTKTLSGEGAVAGNPGLSGTVSPGVTQNDIGTLTFNTSGHVTLNDSGKLRFEVSDAAGVAGTGYDTLSVAGTLALGGLSAGGFTIEVIGLGGGVANWDPLTSRSWTLASTAGITGFDASRFTLITSAFTNNNVMGDGYFAIETSGDNLVLKYYAATSVVAYWDVNGATAGAGGATPAGTWGTSDANWSYSQPGTAQTVVWGNSSGGNEAILAAAADATGSYTVTLSGTVEANKVTIEEGTLNIQSGTLTLKGTAPKITVNPARSATIGSIIAGSSLTKAGTGTLTLSGNNIYTGATALQAGTLYINSIKNADGTSSAVGAPVSAVDGTLAIGNGTSVVTLVYTGAGDTSDRVLDLSGTTGTVTIDQSGAGGMLEFTSALTVSGAGAKTVNLRGSTAGTGKLAGAIPDSAGGATTLLKSGSGTWALSGNSTFSGGLTLTAGGLNLGSATALGAGALTMGGSATLDNTSGGALTVANALRLTGGNLTFTGTGNLTIGGDVLFSGANRMVTVTANTLTLDGAISESGSRALTKAGNGTLVLGNANNAYTGMTTINSGGTLEVKYLADGGLNSSLGASGNAAANLRIMGTLKFSGVGAQTSDRLFSLGSANRLDASGATAGDTITFSNTGSLAWTSVNYTLTLQGSNPGANTLACALVANGTNPLLKQGSGTWVLSGANTYTGLTTVGAAASGNDGVLRIASAAALGTAAAGVTIRGGSNTCRLELAGGITVTGEAVSLEGRATASAVALSNLSGNNTWTGTLTGGAQGAHYNIESQADLLTLSGTLTSNAGSATRTYNLQGAGNGLVSGVINDGTGGETVALTKSGAGTWTLASANTYAGATTISVGTLALSGAGAIDASPTIAVAGGATFDVSAVSYTLASTKTLSGEGAVAGNPGLSGTVSPGVTQDAVGTLTFNTSGHVTLNDSGKLRFEVSDAAGMAGTGYDTLSVAGTLALGGLSAGGFTIEVIGLGGGVANWDPLTSRSWTLASTAGITGFDANRFTLITSAFTNNNAMGDGYFAIETSGDNLVLNYHAASTVVTYWDVNGATAGAGGATPAGTWSTSAANWSYSQPGTAQTVVWGNSSGGNEAIFAGAADATGSYTVTVNGTLEANKVTIEEGTPSIESGTLTLKGTAPKITVNPARSATIGSIIAGSSLTKAGTGTLTLSGNNIYTGATALQAGTLYINSIKNADGTSSAVGAPVSAVDGTLAIGNGTSVVTLVYTGAGDTSDRVLDLSGTTGTVTIDQSGAGGTLEFTSALTVSGAGAKTVNLRGSTAGTGKLAGAIPDSAGGATTLLKSGSGTWALSGNSTFSGGLTLTAGGLHLGSATALGAGALTMGGSATLDNTSGGALTVANALRLTGGNLTFTGTSNLTIGGDVLFSGANRMVTVTANTLTLDGAISESGSRALTKAGNGTLVLGNANNAYTGMTTINSGGTLEVKYLADGGLNSSIGASGNAVANLRIMGTLKFSGVGAQTSDRLFSLGSVNRLDASGATAGDTITFSNTGSLAWTGASYTLTLQGSNTGANTLACALVANGTNPLLKQGSGTWVLSGANAHTGLTTVGADASGNDGVLRIASASALGTTAAGVTIRGGSNTCRLELAGGITVTGEAVSLEGRATASAASLSNLAGNNTWTGTLTGGAQGVHYNLESQADLLTLSGTLTSNAGSATRTYNLQGAGNGLVSGVINDGTGGETVAVTKSGAGTWTLTNANTYAGATTVNGGTLVLAGGAAIADAGAVSLSDTTGATLQLNASETIGSLAGGGTTGGNVDLQGHTLTVGNASSTTYVGELSGTGGSLVKQGSGALTLGGSNSYTGGTTILGTGRIAVSNSNALGSGTVELKSTSALTTAWTLELAGSVTIGNAIAIDSTTGRNYVYASSGDSTISGTITVAGAGSNFIVFGNDGVSTLVLGNAISGASFIGAFSLRGTNPTGGTVSGQVTLPSATFDSNGNTWTIASGGNTWRTTRFNAAGMFVLGQDDALATGAKLLWSSATPTGQAGLDLAGYNQTVAGLDMPTNNSGALALVTNSSGADQPSTLTLSGFTTSYTYAGVIMDGAANRKVSLVMQGVGRTQTLTAVNTYGGDTTLTAGTLSLDADATLGSGAGTLVLNGGTLNTTADRAVGDPVANPLSLTVSSSITTTSAAAAVLLNLTSGSVSGTGGTLTLRNAASSGAGVFHVRFSGGGFSFDRPLVLANGASGTTELQSYNTSGTEQTFGGIVSGAGKYRRSASVSGTGGDTIFTAANTFSGGVTLVDGGLGLGRDSVGAPPALTSGPLGTGGLIVSPGILVESASVFAVGGARVVGNAIDFTGAGDTTLIVGGTNQLTLTGVVDLGTAIRTLKTENTRTTTLSGAVGGLGGLSKSGSGVLALSGSCSYGGDTTVSGGKLQVDGSLSAGGGAVTVNNTATLAGTGTVSRGVTVASGGALAPGADEVGTLSIAGNVTLQSGGALRAKVNSAAPGAYGQVKVTSGAVDLGDGVASLTLDVAGYTPANGDMIWIVNNTGGGATSGHFAGLPADSTVEVGGKLFFIRYDADFDSQAPSGGNDIMLMSTAVDDGMLFEVE